MGGQSPHYGSASTAFHESMHLFGLRDWYNNDNDRKVVGDNDIMNQSYMPNPIMHQIHWNNWKMGVDKQRKGNGNLNKFILNRPVE